MKVAKASFSQMPFHHFMVTRSPNHMWAISWETTSATRSSSSARRPGRVDEQHGLAEGDAAQVLHGPEGEVGDGHEVELVGRVGDAEVVGEEPQGVGGRLEGEGGEVAPCPGRGRRAPACPATSTGVGGLERAHDEGHQVGGHDHGVGEADPAPAAGQRASLDLGAVGVGRQPVGDDEGDREDRLAVGLVEAGEGPAGVGRLELGGGDDVGRRRRRR